MNRPPAGVRAVLRAQRAALDKVVPDRRRALMGIAEDVQRQLEQRLQRLSGSPERYQTQEVRVLLAQVREVVDTLGSEFGVRVGEELEALGREAAGIGRESLLAEIDAWADKFQGSVRRIAPVELAGDLLGPGLLEYYDVSRSTYGMDAIRQMRQSLAASSLSGETVWVATQKLSQKLDMPEWRAERIVRTEQSFALHARQMADLQAAYGPGAPGWKKQLVAVHDDRTGDDSIFVDGQTRALGEPFEDNEGRSYQHPPNRPNDREVVVFVPEVAPSGASGPDDFFGPDVGTHSGRPFDASKAGGPIEQLDWRTAEVTAEDVALVEDHVRRFNDPPLQRESHMVERLKRIVAGEIQAEAVDLRFFTHERRELQRYIALGYPNGQPEGGEEAYLLWNNAHTATLEDYGLREAPGVLFHPGAEKKP